MKSNQGLQNSTTTNLLYYAIKTKFQVHMLEINMKLLLQFKFSLEKKTLGLTDYWAT